MITQSILKEHVHYDPDTGIFTRVKRSANAIQVGDVAGGLSKSNGYLVFHVLNKLWLAHRLAWLYSYGEWPEHQIDHINHNRTDNRLINLRAVTHQENAHNKSLLPKNTSGFNGVSWAKDRNKWRTQIEVFGKVIRLGSFEHIEDAIECRKKANVKYGFHPNHGSHPKGS